MNSPDEWGLTSESEGEGETAKPSLPRAQAKQRKENDGKPRRSRRIPSDSACPAEDQQKPRRARRPHKEEQGGARVGGSRMLRIMNKRSKCRQLRDQAASGNYEAVASLLFSGVDPCVKDHLSGNTALIEAVKGHGETAELLSVIQLLLDSNAEVNGTNEEGMTPLMFAAYHGAGESIVNKLLAWGADPLLQDNTGVTAAMYGAAGGDLHTMTRMLLAIDKSELNVVDEEGLSCLHHAARQDNEAITRQSAVLL